MWERKLLRGLNVLCPGVQGMSSHFFLKSLNKWIKWNRWLLYCSACQTPFVYLSLYTWKILLKNCKTFFSFKRQYNEKASLQTYYTLPLYSVLLKQIISDTQVKKILKISLWPSAKHVTKHISGQDNGWFDSCSVKGIVFCWFFFPKNLIHYLPSSARSTDSQHRKLQSSRCFFGIIFSTGM